MRLLHNTPAAAIAASLRVMGLPRPAPLRHGPAAQIRSVRPDDAGRFDSFVAKLLPASRGARFHGGVAGCAADTLARLVNVDGIHHVAFIATLALADGEEVIGEARYCLDAEDGCAELAIVVADAWHGLGLAEQLIDHLLDEARDAGLRWLFGEVLATNARMIGFMQRMGFRLCAQGAGNPVLRMERDVSPRPPRGHPARPVRALQRWIDSHFTQLGV